jgi:hypothetical protein
MNGLESCLYIDKRIKRHFRRTGVTREVNFVPDVSHAGTIAAPDVRKGHVTVVEEVRKSIIFEM